jgi:tight adherence protein C
VLLIGAVVIFAAIALLVIGLSTQAANPMQARIAAIRGENYSDTYEAPPPADPLSSRVFGPMGVALAEKLKVLLPVQFVKGIEFRLVQAGEPVTLSGFLVIVALVEATMLGMGFVMALASGGLQGRGILVLIGLGFLGLFMPRVWLGNQVRSRQKEILKSLPDAFDLVTTCVEAGLGLDASLAKVAEKVTGPFAEDLGIALREVSLGKLRRDALKEMANKSGVPDLVIFINAVIQAETMGTSIATVLRVQADQMRIRRRQRAEQQAYQAPVKMIFPLVLCIFPTLFIVILGPAAINISQSLLQQK